MHGPLGFIRIIAYGFWALGKMRDLLFSELINFMDKIIPKKSRIDIWATKNTLKALKIQWKFSETFYNMRNLNKVFRAHEKIFWSIWKLDYAHRKIGKGSRKSRKIF